jgi:hypothetical protein
MFSTSAHKLPHVSESWIEGEIRQRSAEIAAIKDKYYTGDPSVQDRFEMLVMSRRQLYEQLAHMQEVRRCIEGR